LAADRRLIVVVAAALLAGPSGGQVAPEPDAPPAAPNPTAPPKSLLPDSFGPVAPPAVAAPAPLPIAPAAAADTGDAGPAALPPPASPAIDTAGLLDPALGGFGQAAFARSDGRFVAGLLRRLTTPIASRWAHITLRRALLTRAPAPPGINPADWIAERARVLLAMGEVDAAKALVDNLPPDRLTPRLIRVTGQAALVAADVPGLCPVADAGGAVSPDPLWGLASAMCTAISGDDVGGASGFETLRHGAVDPFDLQLGERIAMISGGGGRAANLDWDAAKTITPFRFGVAAAAGVPVPLARLVELAAATGGTSWGWVLRAPAQAPDARAAALAPAAALGIASADDMVAAIAAASADLDRAALDASPAGRLRDAYAAPTIAGRVAALRAIWTGGPDADRYAARIETGIAAARLPVDPAFAADTPDLIAAMLAAGIEGRAARWWPVVARGDDAAAHAAWALLAVGANGGIAVSPARFAAFAKDVSPHRAALLLAGLQGLRATRSPAWDGPRRAAGLMRPGTSWMLAIDDAAAAGRSGEVAVLAATGLQARWSAVPPAHLAHVVSALIAVGRGHEARMIAAEAVTRG